jgi:hypothetical protein
MSWPFGLSFSALPPPSFLFSLSSLTGGFRGKWGHTVQIMGALVTGLLWPQGRGINALLFCRPVLKSHVSSCVAVTHRDCDWGSGDDGSMCAAAAPACTCAHAWALCPAASSWKSLVPEPARRGSTKAPPLCFHPWEGQGGLGHWGRDRQWPPSTLGPCVLSPAVLCVVHQSHGSKRGRRKLHVPTPGSCSNW